MWRRLARDSASSRRCSAVICAKSRTARRLKSRWALTRSLAMMTRLSCLAFVLASAVCFRAYAKPAAPTVTVEDGLVDLSWSDGGKEKTRVALAMPTEHVLVCRAGTRAQDHEGDRLPQGCPMPAPTRPRRYSSLPSSARTLRRRRFVSCISRPRRACATARRWSSVASSRATDQRAGRDPAVATRHRARGTSRIALGTRRTRRWARSRARCVLC